MKKQLLFCFFVAHLLLSLTMQAQKPVINHVAVYVHDLAKSTTFYKDVIGLDTIPEPFHDGKHTWLAIGEKSQLHLIAGAPAFTTHDKNNHLCFSVPSMDAFVSRLTRTGIPYEDWPGKPQSVQLRVDGVKQLYIQDPDGYWIEINDAK